MKICLVFRHLEREKNLNLYGLSRKLRNACFSPGAISRRGWCKEIIATVIPQNCTVHTPKKRLIKIPSESFSIRRVFSEPHLEKFSFNYSFFFKPNRYRGNIAILKALITYQLSKKVPVPYFLHRLKNNLNLGKKIEQMQRYTVCPTFVYKLEYMAQKPDIQYTVAVVTLKVCMKQFDRRRRPGVCLKNGCRLISYAQAATTVQTKTHRKRM